MADRRILLVGKRRPALEAAERLGLEVLLWSAAPPGRRERAAVGHWQPLETGAEGPDVEAAADALRPLGRPAAVLALTEGTVPAAARLREALGVPGQPLGSALRCADKQLMKQAARAAGLPCARWATHEEGLSRSQLVERLGLPMYLKPRIGWGSRGARRVRSATRVPDGVPAGYLAEGHVEGEEMSVEALVEGGEPRFVNFTEYLQPGWANLVPRPTDEAERGAIERLLRGALAALGLERGVVHLELFLTADGPVFGELAARPPGGYIFRLIALAYGFDLWEAWMRLELGEDPGPLPAAGAFAAVRLLHPGAGRVTAVEGVADAAALPGVVEARVRVAPGDTLERRAGWGSEAGRIVTRGAMRRDAVEALAAARSAIRIELEPRAAAGA